jgi:hypothetical protein
LESDFDEADKRWYKANTKMQSENAEELAKKAEADREVELTRRDGRKEEMKDDL